MGTSKALNTLALSAPYSDDLGQKVLKAIDSGNRKSHVSQLFNISRNTIDLWLKRRETLGSAAPFRSDRRGPQAKIVDLEHFRAFAQEHGQLTQRGMAEQWVASVSDRTRGKALQRLGCTRKKELRLSRTG